MGYTDSNSLIDVTSIWGSGSKANRLSISGVKQIVDIFLEQSNDMKNHDKRFFTSQEKLS